MKHSTVVSPDLVNRDFLAEFTKNPVGFRVFLPDGSLGIVKRYQDTDQGRIIKVQGIHRNGTFRRLESLSSWFTPDELRVLIYSASINHDWPRL